MYDKELMPVVDDLYLQDQSMINFKTEDQHRTNAVFDAFCNNVEQAMENIARNSASGHVKLDESKILVGDLEEFQEICDDEEEYRNISDVNFSSQRSEVILFVDNREKRNQSDGNYLFDRLLKSGLRVELKSLPLGDFVWVLRVYNNVEDQEEKLAPSQIETKKKKKKAVSLFSDYLLDFIVERKTADDLAASIMDGRYEEQKYRLKGCGLNNVIYLVEGSPGQYCKIPESVLKKAQIHTQIFHNFNVMRLPTIQESLRWLTEMTSETICRIAKMKQQIPDFDTRIVNTLIDYKQFCVESGKHSNMTVQQIFARQLRAVKGLGIENCASTVRVFKTPFLLHKCYSQLPQE